MPIKELFPSQASEVNGQTVGPSYVMLSVFVVKIA